MKWRVLKQSNPNNFFYSVDEFITYWNDRFWLPKIRGTDRQKKVISGAMERQFFRDNWKECIAMVGKSKWLRTQKKPPFDLDFFLWPDNFDKIIEGKYADSDNQPERYSTQIDGEEFIL